MKEPTCPVTRTVKIIGSKWTILILYQLRSGVKRFGELEKILVGISPKTLSQRLQELEKEAFITKKVFHEVPLRVEYSLTERGKSVGKIIDEMAKWGEEQK
ncbi:MAG: helix-turn-helix domain-containing protein [Patescibacteria group bacterium]